MSRVEPRDLIQKLNFVISSRYVKQAEAVEEYLPIPQTKEEEQAAVVEMMFRYLKKHFVGSKIRTRTYGFSIRLDGIAHRRAKKISEDFYGNQEWRRWFEQNHRRMSDVINRNSNSFGHNFGRTEKDGKIFLYIPHRLDRIPNYVQNGFHEYLSLIKREITRDNALSEIYEQAINLVEAEVQRKEAERLERLRTELRQYQSSIQSKLFKNLNNLTDDRSTASGKLRHKMRLWAAENGLPNQYAEEPTFDRVVPLETKVRIMNQVGSKEENWFAFPVFETDFAIPEGYVLQNGWGRITKHSENDERSRGGVAPLVVENYMYVSFDIEHWKSLLPENYLRALEATRRFRAEAEAECEAERCREEEVQAVEFAQERERAEADAVRVATLAEQLRAQVTQTEVPRPDVDTDFFGDAPVAARPRRAVVPDVVLADVEIPQGAVEQAQATPIEEARTHGIYLNANAIPLERYVLVIDNVIVARKYNLTRINTYIDDHTDYSSANEAFDDIYSYQEPTTIVETNDN